MSRSPDYDIEAADLVARTLRAVAADTDVAGRDDVAVPIGGLPAPVDLATRRSRRLRRTVLASAAAAAVLVAGVVWVGHDPSRPSNTSAIGAPVDGTGLAPAEIVPDHIPDGLEPLPGLHMDQGVLYNTQAFLLEPPEGGQLLTVVVTPPDGALPTADDLSRMADALSMMTGTETGRSYLTAAPNGEPVGYVTLPIGDVGENVVAMVHDELVAQGIGVERFAVDSGWVVRDVDVSWVPGVAPTVGRRYSDVGRNLDVYAAFGDIASARDTVPLMHDAAPYPVEGNMGWQTTTAEGDTVVVWQAAPGTIAAVVAGEAVADQVPAVIESMPVPRPTPGDHPDWHLVGRSEDGDVPWVVEAGQFLPGIAERPCMNLWVAGQVPLGSCSLAQMPTSYSDQFSTLTQVDDDVSVVFGLFAPAVASVATDAPGAEHATVEAQPFDPGDPMSLRYAVMIVHGGKEQPQTFRFLDAQGEVLDTRTLNLNEVGG
jgi:hypothetical protein